MDPWLKPALDYIPQWLGFQMRASEQPGCAIAIAHEGRVVLERAFGHADLAHAEALTPRHRFRVASHSKSFTAAGIMLLREQGRLTLDDAIGKYVTGLRKEVASVTIAQLLSHSAGLTRDGPDSGQFADRIPYRSAADLLADLGAPPPIEPGTRFKYSNHGFALLGMAMAAITGEDYARWIRREVIAAAGLRETEPAMPARPGVPFARGHSEKLLLRRRLVIPADNDAHAIGPAAGFTATAADLTRFFWQLAPQAKRSFLSVASRREMVRRQWRNPDSMFETYYGLGTISGTLGGWDWVGHSGGWQGVLTRAVAVPKQGLSVAVLTNAQDATPAPWLDGILHILRLYAENGPPVRRVSGWTGRWWSLGGAVDLVPAGEKLFVASPGLFNPLMDASEIEVTGRDSGRIALAQGFGSHGESVRRVRDAKGQVSEVWLGGGRLLAEPAAAKDLLARYDASAAKAKARAPHPPSSRSAR